MGMQDRNGTLTEWATEKASTTEWAAEARWCGRFNSQELGGMEMIDTKGFPFFSEDPAKAAT